MMYLNRYKTTFLFTLLTAVLSPSMEVIDNMICINNIVVTLETIGCPIAESEMIKSDAAPALIGTMIYAGFNPFPV